MKEKSCAYGSLHTEAFTTPMCRSQIYYLFFRQFQKQNLHSAFWRRSAQRGRLRGLHASESRHAGPVCCNGWVGLSVVSRASPDYVAPPPSTTRRTTLPRTGLCLYACRASASGDTAPHAGRGG